MTKIPPLAGLGTFEDAAVEGVSVDDNVNRLVRYAWAEKRAMEACIYWLNPTPEWEVKEALSLHCYYSADHAADIRERVTEMRNPPPNMNKAPDHAFDAFLREIWHAETTLEKLVGLYDVLYASLLDAYQAHYDATNPLVDFPTRRLLKHLIIEKEEALAWGHAAIDALITSDADQQQADKWRAHLQAFLDGAGGIWGEAPPTDAVPNSRTNEPYAPDFFPQRDERFVGRWNFVFPPHEVARMEGIPSDERTLALMCKRTLEMDVPEAMARMIAEADNKPWDYYVDMCRQLWDEARHAMMGSVYFEDKGIDWRRMIPLHPGFAIRLNQHLDAHAAHAVLYTIEQSLMPAKTGKRFEWETAIDASDTLATLFQDYDWADEVLHSQIGRRWLITDDESRDDIVSLGREKAVASENVLDAYKDKGEQVNWWQDFVAEVLGKPSAVVIETDFRGDPVYRNAKTASAEDAKR